jgi:hypothetical protein
VELLLSAPDGSRSVDRCGFAPDQLLTALELLVAKDSSLGQLARRIAELELLLATARQAARAVGRTRVVERSVLPQHDPVDIHSTK